MRVLVTAGNTQVPIDRVRCITNIFTGRTGTRIALHAHALGHQVHLLTSHPGVVTELHSSPLPAPERWTVQCFQTFDDLHAQMEAAIRPADLDAIIHCAAVSDYQVDGVYAPAPETHFDVATGFWRSTAYGPALVDRRAGKVKSDAPELWLRLVRAPKLIDRIRTDWGFRGVLVKFKLEVDLDERSLQEIGEQSRQQSQADLMVANTLEGAAAWALLGPVDGRYQRIDRADLPARLWEAIGRIHGGRTHG